MKAVFPTITYFWLGTSMSVLACGIISTAQIATNPASTRPVATIVAPSVTATYTATPPFLATTALPTEQILTQPPLAPTEIPNQAAGDLETITLSPVVAVTELTRPVGLANAGDGSNRLFIVENAGRIMILQSGSLAPLPFLDIRDRVTDDANEKGLLGLAFHPDYESNGYFYVNYTAENTTRISRFAVTSNPAIADPASEQILLTIEQPAGNHNGGHLAFGPDSYLYIGMGDGGGADDRFGNGQNPSVLLGKMLRIDVNMSTPYAVPPGNPFSNPNDGIRDEIWATGLRNPWRFSFDRLTGDLYIADVGQNSYEEVNVQPATSQGGENYGWPLMEGLHCFPENVACDRSGLMLPIIEYDRQGGCSITGGYVYRGSSFPALYGIYFFGDYCTGIVWGAASNPAGIWESHELSNIPGLVSFGEDEDGELYAISIEGSIYLMSQ